MLQFGLRCRAFSSMRLASARTLLGGRLFPLPPPQHEHLLRKHVVLRNHLVLPTSHKSSPHHQPRISVPNLKRMASPQRIVWIDLETTGLNADTDIILEIAVVITDDLGRNEVDAQGLQLVIHADKVVLDGMVPACIPMHRESGLTDACIASSNTKEGVVNQVMAYIKRWVPYKHTAYLGGSSIHFDRAFLARHMPEIVSYLKYQQLDVTSIMIATKALYQGQRQPPRAVNTKHRAMNDIRDTIACYKYYLTTFFRPHGDVMNAGRPLTRSETMPTVQASGSSVGQNIATERHEPGGVVRRVTNGAHNTKPYDAPPTKQGEH